MIIKNLINIGLISLIAFSSYSQIDRKNFCSHDQENYDRMAVDPAYKKTLDSIEVIQQLNKIAYKENNVNRAGTIYYIPVVYHVIHEGGPENISDEQIYSDLEEMNKLYRKQNSNVGNVKSNFLPIVADIEIEFRLAQKKPDGTCFSGITRTFSAETNTGRNAAMEAVKSAQGNFPGNQYLNILVAKDIGGAAGYTYRPGGPYYSSMNNGIHVLHTYVGNIGTSTQTGVNTTLAHEAGHWLGLPHLWGGTNSPGISTNCSSDDGISDTPNTVGWSYCNLNGTSCGSLDNVENIMEYSYCSKMFTEGQKTTMRAVLNSTVAGRNNIITTANHNATGIFSDIICLADFSSDKTIVCQNEPVEYSDKSYHNATSWNWRFDGGTPSTSTLENPVVTYSSPGRHSVFLTVSNASGSKSVSKSQYIKVLSSWGVSPFNEGFEGSNTDFLNNWTPATTSGSNWIQSNASKSGSKSIKLPNYNNGEGTISELNSGSINLLGSQSVSISYDYAYARKSTTVSETVQLLYSRDCGNTWLIARGLNPSTASKNSDFTPTSSDWNYQSVNINAAYFTSNFRFKFKLTNGGGNNIYIDNININRTLGTEEINNLSSLSIFPNPMNQQSTIELDVLNQSNISISIINVLGEKVSTIIDSEITNSGNHKFQINKNSLNTGIYFVKVTVDGKSKLKKLIIN